MNVGDNGEASEGSENYSDADSGDDELLSLVTTSSQNPSKKSFFAETTSKKNLPGSEPGNAIDLKEIFSDEEEDSDDEEVVCVSDDYVPSASTDKAKVAEASNEEVEKVAVEDEPKLEASGSVEQKEEVAEKVEAPETAADDLTTLKTDRTLQEGKSLTLPMTQEAFLDAVEAYDLNSNMSEGIDTEEIQIKSKKKKIFSKEIPMSAEDTWDFTLNSVEPNFTSKCLWLEGTFHQKLSGECLHEMHTVNCPCDSQMRFVACRLCNMVFCSPTCFKQTLKTQIGSTRHKQKAEGSNALERGDKVNGEPNEKKSKEKSKRATRQDEANELREMFQASNPIIVKQLQTEEDRSLNKEQPRKDNDNPTKSNEERNQHSQFKQQQLPQQKYNKKIPNELAQLENHASVTSGIQVQVPPTALWPSAIHHKSITGALGDGLLGPSPVSQFVQKTNVHNPVPHSRAVVNGYYPQKGGNHNNHRINNFPTSGFQQPQNKQMSPNQNQQGSSSVLTNPGQQIMGMITSKENQSELSQHAFPGNPKKPFSNANTNQNRSYNSNTIATGPQTTPPLPSSNMKLSPTIRGPSTEKIFRNPAHEVYSEQKQTASINTTDSSEESPPYHHHYQNNPSNQKPNLDRFSQSQGHNKVFQQQPGSEIFPNSYRGNQNMRGRGKQYYPRADNPGRGPNNYPNRGPGRNSDFVDIQADGMRHMDRPNHPNFKRNFNESSNNHYGNEDQRGKSFFNNQSRKHRDSGSGDDRSQSLAAGNTWKDTDSTHSSGSSTGNRREQNKRDVKQPLSNRNENQSVETTLAYAEKDKVNSASRISDSDSFRTASLASTSSSYKTAQSNFGTSTDISSMASNISSFGDDDSKPISNTADVPFGIYFQVKHLRGKTFDDFVVVPANKESQLLRDKLSGALQRCPKARKDVFEVNDNCIIKYSGQDINDDWHRAVITKVTQGKIGMYLIDLGMETMVDPSSVYKLPAELLEYRPTAVRFRTLNFTTRPADAEDVSQYFKDLVEGKTVKIKITHKVTFQPFLYGGYLEVYHSNKWYNAGSFLKMLQVAEEVHKICGPGLQPIEVASPIPENCLPCSTTSTLEGSIKYALSLNEFYIATKESVKRKFNIEKELNSVAFTDKCKPVEKLQDLSTSIYAVHCDIDETYVRVKVIEVTEDEGSYCVKVQKIDHGEIITVPFTELLQLPDSLHQPSCVYRCCLPVKAAPKSRSRLTKPVSFESLTEHLEQLYDKLTKFIVFDVEEMENKHIVEVFLEESKGCSDWLISKGCVTLTHDVDLSCLKNK